GIRDKLVTGFRRVLFRSPALPREELDVSGDRAYLPDELVVCLGQRAIERLRARLEHDPVSLPRDPHRDQHVVENGVGWNRLDQRSGEHTSELQSLAYLVC